MATRAAIICNTNEGMRGAYSHWDGYLSGLGVKLRDHFNSYDKAVRLISEGDIAEIDDEGDVRYFKDTPWTPFAGNTWREVATMIPHNNNIYVMKDGEWYWTDSNKGELEPLNDAIFGATFLTVPEQELPYNYGMQESIVNLKKEKIMSDVLCGKIWFGAFEDGNEVLCVGNFDMPVKKMPVTTNDWVWACEKIYRGTQNMFDSWSLTAEQLNEFFGDSEKQDGADWIAPKNMKGNRARDNKPIGHRSMSVGDVVQFGRDSQEKTYWAVAGFGFVELSYSEYSEWHDMDSRERSDFIGDIARAKREEEVAC